MTASTCWGGNPQIGHHHGNLAELAAQLGALRLIQHRRHNVVRDIATESLADVFVAAFELQCSLGDFGFEVIDQLGVLQRNRGLGA